MERADAYDCAGLNRFRYAMFDTSKTCEHFVHLCARLGADLAVSGAARLCDTVFHLEFLYRAERERTETVGLSPGGTRAALCDSSGAVRIEKSLDRADVFGDASHTQRADELRSGDSGRRRRSCRSVP